MTDAEKQRRSFAYGNAAIDNPNVTREMIDKAAEEITMTTPTDAELKCDCQQNHMGPDVHWDGCPMSRVSLLIRLAALSAEVEAYEGMKEGAAIRIADLEAEVDAYKDMKEVWETRIADLTTDGYKLKQVIQNHIDWWYKPSENPSPSEEAYQKLKDAIK